MKEALTLKLAETRDNLKTDPVLAEAKDEQLSEEVSVKLMADLQERQTVENNALLQAMACLLYTSPSPRDGLLSRMPSSA